MNEQVDWVVCFSLIKIKNPILWYQLNHRENNLKVDTLSNALNSELELLIPEVMKLFFPKYTLKYLKAVFKFYCENSGINVVSFGFEEIKALSIFSRGLSKSTFKKFILGCYADVLTVLALYKEVSLREKTIQFNTLYEFQKCFQLLILSYTCFELNLVTDQRYARSFILEHLLMDFIKVPLMLSSKITYCEELFEKMRIDYQNVHKKQVQNIIQKFDLQLYLKLHFPLVTTFINLKLRLCDVIDKEKENHEEFCEMKKIIEELLFIIESLCHVLINIRIKQGTLIIESLKHKAYGKRFLNRTKMISQRYINEIQSLKFNTSFEKCLLEILDSIIEINSTINWPLIEKLNKESDINRNLEIFNTRRTFIESAILMLDDLNLISKFRLTPWPCFQTK